jgi:hypothetical protein
VKSEVGKVRSALGDIREAHSCCVSTNAFCREPLSGEI